MLVTPPLSPMGGSRSVNTDGLLIDWITTRVSRELLSAEEIQALDGWNDRIMRFCPRTGSMVWEMSAWDSVRSDSHQISLKWSGSELWLQGSPARCIGEGDTVFGAGASAALDVPGCVSRMVDFAGGMLSQSEGIEIDLARVPLNAWKVSRVDVTGNLMLASLEEVRQALSILRNLDGGRYRTSQQSGDTVYWSHRSRMRSGKAYAKGPHLEYLKKKKTYEGREHDQNEIYQANRLLRLELSLKREFCRRHDPMRQSPEFFAQQWHEYFMTMIGDAEMNDESKLQEQVMKVAPTKGIGKAAWGQWCAIKAYGREAARDMYTESTWYRNQKVLRAAGLGDADLSTGRVVQLRRKKLVTQLCRGWEDLKAA